MRLEQEPSPFSAKEIIVKVQYKYCPNLTIIDTPGLIAPAPGLKNRALQVLFFFFLINRNDYQLHEFYFITWSHILIKMKMNFCGYLNGVDDVINKILNN